MTGEALWTSDETRADGSTVFYMDAVKDFARSYWAQPRKARVTKADADGVTFTMVNGAGRTYGLRRVKGPFGWRLAVSVVCRCGHPQHEAQCPNPGGCWCDTFAQAGA